MDHEMQHYNLNTIFHRPIKLRFVFAAFVLALLAIGFAPKAFSNLSASPIIMTFYDGGPTRKDMTLKNTGSRPQYLDVTAYRIANPGQQPEILQSDPNPENIGLLVAPRRITLNPGEQKVIRIIRLEETSSQEQAWRVHIKPVKVEFEAASSSALVQIGYKALIIARPKDAIANLTGSRNGKILTVSNTGNSNAVLRQGSQCNEAGSACKKITGKRLWPGDEWQTELPYDTPVTFKIIGPQGEEEISY